MVNKILEREKRILITLKCLKRVEMILNAELEKLHHGIFTNIIVNGIVQQNKEKIAEKFKE